MDQSTNSPAIGDKDVMIQINFSDYKSVLVKYSTTCENQKIQLLNYCWHLSGKTLKHIDQ